MNIIITFVTTAIVFSFIAAIAINRVISIVNVLEAHVEALQLSESSWMNKHREVDERRAALMRTASCLELDLQESKELVSTLRADLREAHQQLRERKQLSSVSFMANIPHLGWTKTRFALGVGPCGKEVQSIQFVEHPDHYMLIQRCTDGERKEFEYKKVDIAGRIERAYVAPQE